MTPGGNQRFLSHLSCPPPSLPPVRALAKAARSQRSPLMSYVWSASGFTWTIPNCHKLSGGLPTTETYFSQHWRLEVRNQGAGLAGFWRESPLGGDRRLTPHASSHGGESSGIFVILEEHQCHHGGSTLLASSKPNPPPKPRLPIPSHWGRGLQHGDFQGTRAFRV